jgi:hypothetical protein
LTACIRPSQSCGMQSGFVWFVRWLASQVLASPNRKILVAGWEKPIRPFSASLPWLVPTAASAHLLPSFFLPRIPPRRRQGAALPRHREGAPLPNVVERARRSPTARAGSRYSPHAAGRAPPSSPDPAGGVTTYGVCHGSHARDLW